MKLIFAGHETELTPEGGLWIPALGLLCVADLHFEKGSFYEARAIFLPPYASLETLERLEDIVRRLRPSCFIAAGDSFHDKKAALRLPKDLRVRLNDLISTVSDWHWLMGNHDPDLPDIIAGQRAAELTVGGICVRHQSEQGSQNEVSGHYHPKVRMRLRSQTISAACFVLSESKLFLPSFGQYTGGLDIDSAAFLAVAPREGRRVFARHQNRVFAI